MSIPFMNMTLTIICQFCKHDFAIHRLCRGNTLIRFAQKYKNMN